MKNTYLLILFIIISNAIFSQNISFQQVPPALPEIQNIAPFKTLTYSDIIYVDIDNDNDLDVLTTGLSCISGLSCAEIILYINDGNGSYSEVAGTNLTAISYGAIACADVDNDNDQDIFITGKNYQNQAVSKLFINNGNYTFSLSTSSSFIALCEGDVEFADIDNDNDMDVLITGKNGNTGMANLYKNNGSGSFTLVTGTSFLAGINTKIGFFDIDNDFDQDILIHQNLSSSSPNHSISILYKNNGSGTFTIIDTLITDNSSFAYGDIDGDNDLDLLFAGKIAYNTYPQLYLNNGSGIYSLTSNPFTRLGDACFGFIDFDNDNDLDVILSGSTSSGNETKLYLNDSLGNYTVSPYQPFPGVKDGQLTFIDIDSNSYMDVIVSGTLSGIYPNLLNPINLYVNDSGVFRLSKGSPFYDIIVNSIEYIDIDGDNDQDILVMGRKSSVFQIVSRFYINDGNGSYTMGPGISFGNYIQKFKFADIDNDNDLDVLVLDGETSGTPINTRLYKNNGNGSFSLISGTPFVGVNGAIAEFGDIDNDGDLDLFISGETNYNNYSVGLYENNGNGIFSLVPNTPFIGTYLGEAAFADVDGDSDLDMFLTGSSNNGPKFLLYLNNGSGGFSLSNTSSFYSMSARFAVADIDNDNDIDLLLTGEVSISSIYSDKTFLYRNNGSGIYTIDNSTSFSDMKNGAVVFADFDNDNDKDVILIGSNYSLKKTMSQLYNNDGLGNFTLQPQVSFAKVNLGAITILDINNDNKKDVIITGLRNSGDHIARLYRNTSCNSESIDSVTACQSYTWINGITYTASNDTAFFITSNNAGCDSIIRLSLTLDTLNINTITSDPSIMAVATNASYQWLNCGNNYTPIAGATSQSFTAISNGDYAVEITQNNCTDTSLCVSITSTGINVRSEFDNISVFPNPSSGVVNINLGNQKNIDIKVFSVSGKLVYQKDDISVQLYKLDFDGPVGLYFLELSNGAKKQRFKLIKKSSKE